MHIVVLSSYLTNHLDVTGNIGVTGTVDGVDIQTLNTTAGAALPKAGGTMTGHLNLGATGTDNDSHYIYFKNGGAAIARDNNDLELHGYSGIVLGASNTSYPASTQRIRIDSSGDISFYEDTGANAKMLWDASGESLSIGVTGSATDRRFQISSTNPSTATTQYGIVANPTMSNDVTGSI